MARLVASRPSTAGSSASSSARPSSSQSTATNFSRPLSTGPRRNASSSSSQATSSTRPTSMASSLDVVDEAEQEPEPSQKGKTVAWHDKHGRFGGRWVYVEEMPRALYDDDHLQHKPEAREVQEAEPEEVDGDGLHRRRSRRSTRLSLLSALQAAEDEQEANGTASRNVSGETLVPANNAIAPTEQLLDQALDLDWEVEKLPSPQKRGKVEETGKGKGKSRLSMIGNAIASTASALGKRGRQALESGKEKLQALKDDKTKGKHRLDAVDEEDAAVAGERPAKRARIDAASGAKVIEVVQTTVAESQLHGWRRKRWLAKGLYVGQERDFDARLNEARNRKKRASKVGSASNSDNKIMPLPMFRGQDLLENGSRDFRLPFDVFSPLPPGHEKPDTWGKFQKNRFVGDAAIEWKHHKPLPQSRCLCTPEDGCDENCQNRFMLYECDDSNCNVGAENCGNRAFADLRDRHKSGRKYDIGVEVVKTEAKGFGIRACRTFEPGQIVMEYAGEIITQEECERRVATEYKDNACYYLMTFDQKMIIDATRGSIARFINHSCEPNCHMVKWVVEGKPRMALFAGDDGVMTGEELTYDYNFDPFSQKNVQTCHCGAPSCRGFLGPKPKPNLPRTSRSVSADVDERSNNGNGKKGTSLLKRASSSLQNLLTSEPSASTSISGNNRTTKRKSTGSASALLTVAKKRRRNTDTNLLALDDDTLDSADVSDKRITSESTLVEPSASTSTSVATGKTAPYGKPSKARRNTIDALRGVAKTIKRNASTLRAHASLRRAVQRDGGAAARQEIGKTKTTATDHARESLRRSAVPALEKLEVDFDGGDDAIDQGRPALAYPDDAADGDDATAADEAQHRSSSQQKDTLGQAAIFGQSHDDTDDGRGKSPVKKGGRAQSISSMIRPGIVRSIKGSTRVAAAKRAGMRLGRGGKSLRVVTASGDATGGEGEGQGEDKSA